MLTYFQHLVDFIWPGYLTNISALFDGFSVMNIH